MKAFPYEGLTYDDVTLVTQYADFLPDEASLETRLTTRVSMKIPFVSAAMDTVTEAPMAVAMALAGGIGVIHKNLEEDDQAKEVAKVKTYLNGLIASPICFSPVRTGTATAFRCIPISVAPISMPAWACICSTATGSLIFSHTAVAKEPPALG